MMGASRRERRGRRGLLGLPSELRNRIYDFALFHERSNGIIAPHSDCLNGYNLPPDSATLIDEHLLITEHASLQVFEQSLWENERPGKIFAYSGGAHSPRLYRRLPRAASAHESQPPDPRRSSSGLLLYQRYPLRNGQIRACQSLQMVTGSTIARGLVASGWRHQFAKHPSYERPRPSAMLLPASGYHGQVSQHTSRRINYSHVRAGRDEHRCPDKLDP